MENIIEQLKSNGWVFVYDPETKYISACHRNGGKQSICDVRHPYDKDQLGFEIANLMNNKI